MPFLGRVWRKKRKVLLLAVRAVPPAPPMSLWRPPAHHVPGQERQWFEACYRAHCAFCGCGSFILHLTSLAARFNFQGGPPPPGGPRPEDPPALRALPAPEAETPRRHVRRENPGGDRAWRGAGGGRGDGDGADPSGAAAGGGYDEGDLDALFAAVEEDREQ